MHKPYLVQILRGWFRQYGLNSFDTFFTNCVVFVRQIAELVLEIEAFQQACKFFVYDAVVLQAQPVEVGAATLGENGSESFALSHAD